MGVWKHPNARIAYVAQHAFHHIESHLTKTPNEYIRWRYANQGEDKESLVKVTMQFSEEELALQKTPYAIQFTDEETGKITKVKKVVGELCGGRKTNKSKEYEYEVRYAGSTVDSGEYLPAKTLKKMGWDKAMKATDLKIAQRAGLYVRPLSIKNVEAHLEDVGLDKEFGTHYRMSALSGGQKVKVVMAAALWNQPHILILDEPPTTSIASRSGPWRGPSRPSTGALSSSRTTTSSAPSSAPRRGSWTPDTSRRRATPSGCSSRTRRSTTSSS